MPFQNAQGVKAATLSTVCGCEMFDIAAAPVSAATLTTRESIPVKNQNNLALALSDQPVSGFHPSFRSELLNFDTSIEALRSGAKIYILTSSLLI
jgi:hypothetical protein